jgi:hypothetical protein
MVEGALIIAFPLTVEDNQAVFRPLFRNLLSCGEPS